LVRIFFEFSLETLAADRTVQDT